MRALGYEYGPERQVVCVKHLLDATDARGRQTGIVDQLLATPERQSDRVKDLDVTEMPEHPSSCDTTSNSAG